MSQLEFTDQTTPDATPRMTRVELTCVCAKTLAVNAELAGQKITCPKCRELLDVPSVNAWSLLIHPNADGSRKATQPVHRQVEREASVHDSSSVRTKVTTAKVAGELSGVQRIICEYLLTQGKPMTVNAVSKGVGRIEGTVRTFLKALEKKNFLEFLARDRVRLFANELAPSTMVPQQQPPKPTPPEPQQAEASPEVKPEPETITVPEWVSALQRSKPYLRQHEAAGRRPPKHQEVARFLSVMAASRGVASRPVLIARLNLPLIRFRGFLSLMVKVLNLDGAQILTHNSDEVRLNLEILYHQFGIDSSEE